MDIIEELKRRIYEELRDGPKDVRELDKVAKEVLAPYDHRLWPAVVQSFVEFYPCGSSFCAKLRGGLHLGT